MLYRFDSDYLEGCIPEILEKFSSTNLEQTPGYGEDPHCERAKSLIKEACGNKQADVHFLVGGTQTNVTVISALLRPHQGVVCAETGHINVHETGAVEHSGHKVLALRAIQGKITAEQVEETMQNHKDDPTREHAIQPGMVYISFPTEVGTLYSKDELQKIAAVCRKWQIPLFVDGARLGYGLYSPENDVTLKDLAQLADVFYIGGTKQGALFGEAVVFSTQELSKDFRYFIKQNGGMLAKGRLLGLQFEALFEEGRYLKYAQNAIDKAMELKAALKAKGYEFLAESPTNQQFPIMENAQIEKLAEKFGFETWGRIDAQHTAVRFVTSWATPQEAVQQLISEL